MFRYGTGCFLLYNTGQEPVISEHGLLTTVAYQLGPSQPAVYALEGSVAIAGACVRWLRDNIGILEKSSDIGLYRKIKFVSVEYATCIIAEIVLAGIGFVVFLNNL